MPQPYSIDVPHLAAWCQYKLISQRALAKQSGITTTTIRRAERGGAVRYVTLHSLAGALGVPAQTLLSAPEAGNQWKDSRDAPDAKDGSSNGS